MEEWCNDQACWSKIHTEELHHSLQSNNHKTHLRWRRSQYIDLILWDSRIQGQGPLIIKDQIEDMSMSAAVMFLKKPSPTMMTLYILLSKSPVSPNLKKQKKNKQAAPNDPFWSNNWPLKNKCLWMILQPCTNENHLWTTQEAFVFWMIPKTNRLN